VLVVRTLDPDLAPWLPGLAGLVADSASCCRTWASWSGTSGVPTAINVTDAVDRFPPGTLVTVDGATGEVAAVDKPDRGAA
jgi:rifampicin phosphotransferase